MFATRAQIPEESGAFRTCAKKILTLNSTKVWIPLYQKYGEPLAKISNTQPVPMSRGEGRGAGQLQTGNPRLNVIPFPPPSA